MCEFVLQDGKPTCSRCGRKGPSSQPLDKIYAQCLVQPDGVEQQPKPWQLGDDLETMLTALGVTKDKWKAAKQKFGLPPNCGCAARQEWLNRVSENLQVKSKQLAETLRTYFSVPR